MKSKIILAVFSLVFLCLFLGCIFPYPFGTNHSILTSKEQRIINEFNETKTEIIRESKNVNFLNQDWATVVDNLFEPHMQVLVIDLNSNLEFYINRVGGYNHADVQAVTDSDNLVLQMICKNKKSDIPVWVKIKNNFYCASLNMSNHKTENNKNLHHISLYFKNSKTHGTDKVDVLHQKTIKKAYKSKNQLIKYLEKKDNKKIA